MKKYHYGFTLIELLVVIAIIAILSSVVLASLSAARERGADAAVIANLNNARAQADLYYSENGNSFNSVCDLSSADTPPGISNFVAAADEANAAGAVNCFDAADAGVARGWAAEAQLVSDTNLYHCTDYTGRSGSYTGSTISDSDVECGP